MNIPQTLATELQVRPAQVEAVLSLMADGTIIWRVAPNELPVAAVGQTFSMAVVLEITNGNFGLFSSGHKAITITP